jgi:hypothetical protein
MRISFSLSLMLAPALALAACGEAVQDNHFADDVDSVRPVSDPVTSEAVPVRIGELGPSFPACNATGTTRNLAEGETLSVRAAPFDTAPETGRVPANARFAICSRSHDQKWFGVVFAEGEASQDCGVSAPVTSRRAYEGPCRSGWVSSPFVKLVAATKQEQAPDSKAENRL